MDTERYFDDTYGILRTCLVLTTAETRHSNLCTCLLDLEEASLIIIMFIIQCYVLSTLIKDSGVVELLVPLTLLLPYCTKPLR